MLLPIVIALIFGAASSIFAMFGLGGGLFYAPTLVLLGLPPSAAAFISLVAITSTSIAAFTVYKKAEKVSWKLAAVVDPPTDIMAFIGGIYAYLIEREAALLILVAVMLIAGWLMLKPTPSSRSTPSWLSHFNIVIKHGDQKFIVNLPITVAVTAAIGFAAGAVGITGGVFKVPLMVLLCGVPIDIAVATSSFMVLLTAIFGLAGHLSAQAAFSAEAPWLLIATAAAATFLGGALGALKAVKVEKTKLRKGYSILMFGLAFFIILKELL